MHYPPPQRGWEWPGVTWAASSDSCVHVLIPTLLQQTCISGPFIGSWLQEPTALRRQGEEQRAKGPTIWCGRNGLEPKYPKHKPYICHCYGLWQLQCPCFCSWQETPWALTSLRSQVSRAADWTGLKKTELDWRRPTTCDACTETRHFSMSWVRGHYAQFMALTRLPELIEVSLWKPRGNFEGERGAFYGE